jgi:cell wall-associated NlpC family hydrolase
MHGQGKKGIGTDCVGFIIQVGKYAGWINSDYTPPVYSSQWSLHRDESLLVEEVAKFCRPLSTQLGVITNRSKLRSGDILVYRYARTAGHAGIYMSNGNVVHADITARKVVESTFDSLYSMLSSIWRPNV